jgi:hypothetical protein
MERPNVLGALCIVGVGGGSVALWVVAVVPIMLPLIAAVSVCDRLSPRVAGRRSPGGSTEVVEGYMRKAAYAIVGLAASAAVVLAGDSATDTCKPAAGYVPDANTAITIAVAVWGPIYGAAEIAAAKPYRAHLSGGVWTVEGSLACDDSAQSSVMRRGRMPVCAGGVAVAEIARDDGRILRVGHGK